MTLASLLDQVKQYPGISQKEDIALLAPQLMPLPSGWHPNGDDTAAIPNQGGYSLFAIEGFINSFVEQDPWFAGWCSVMVNVSDVAAMGGRPTAVVNALWNNRLEHAQKILEGMTAAANAYGVPIIGGHTNLQSAQAQLAVSVIGQAQQLLSSFAADSGQVLVAAIDLRGSFRAPYLNWNAATTAPPEQLRENIELLPLAAEQQLAIAAKDISQAGLLGTALMLLESSSVGAHIDLSCIPKPVDVEWADWLCAFPSFGYLLTTEKSTLPSLLQHFNQQGISAAAIGHITDDQQLWVHQNTSCELFRDLKHCSMTGFNQPARAFKKEDK